MNQTRLLSAHGQSIWLDNITRSMLDSGGLQDLIEHYQVSGLTSNPTIFERALRESSAYESSIRAHRGRGLDDEAVFFELALEDLRRAALLLKPVFDASKGVDGWVSLEVSPLLATDTAGTTQAALQLHQQADCANLLVKIPGTPAGVPAIEAAIFAGVPVNVTLLFSETQYLAAAQAYVSGIERRIAAGLDPVVGSVASVFVSRWDQSVLQQLSAQDPGAHAKTAASTAADSPPAALNNVLGIAMAQRCLSAHQQLFSSPRWLAAAAAGAQPQRLLWASTGSKDPALSDVHYVESLIAAGTINTMPEATLRAYADHGSATQPMPSGTEDADAVIQRLHRAGVSVDQTATQLQQGGVLAFAQSWSQLMSRIKAVA